MAKRYHMRKSALLKPTDMSEALLEPDKTDIPNAPEKRRLHLTLLQLPPPLLG